MKKILPVIFISILALYSGCKKEEENPTACFTVNKTAAIENEMLEFTNCSENATAYYWEFGDGEVSTLSLIQRAYAIPGVYEVKLTVWLGEKTSVTTQVITITEDPMPVACFTASSSTIKVGEEITFTNCSVKAESYLWDFGDGSTSTTENPVHIFNDAGAFMVMLTASNIAGSSQETASITVETAGVLLSEGFEDYPDFSITDFGDWTLIDNDGAPSWGVSGIDFPNYGYTGSFIVFNPSQTVPPATDQERFLAHSGEKYAACFSAKFVGDVTQNDDWMMSPAFVLGDNYSLSLWIKSLSDEYGPDRFIIQLIEGETIHWLTPVDSYVIPPTAWNNYTYDLAPYAGKTVALKIGCYSSDAFSMFIDDIVITNEAGKQVFKQTFEETPMIKAPERK
ncbi:MAG: PKD domain-containing protein [Lentimicrobium sp.]